MKIDKDQAKRTLAAHGITDLPEVALDLMLAVDNSLLLPLGTYEEQAFQYVKASLVRQMEIEAGESVAPWDKDQIAVNRTLEGHMAFTVAALEAAARDLRRYVKSVRGLPYPASLEGVSLSEAQKAYFAFIKDGVWGDEADRSPESALRRSARLILGEEIA